MIWLGILIGFGAFPLAALIWLAAMILRRKP